jgi:ParB-like chromosome segregation protein Spo0J
MKVVNQVNQTNDYEMFKTLDGNRTVNKLHVSRLKESFKTAYLLSPILINQQNQIIDGQHRFEAAKILGLPVNYIICNDYGLKEV